MVFVGIDNGITGSYGEILENGDSSFTPVPTIKELDFQSTKKKYITRINNDILCKMFSETQSENSYNIKCMVEIPLQNPHLWKASVSAVRAFESTLIALQRCNISYEFISAQKWRKMFLPGYTNTMKAAEAKKLGMEIGIRMYPQHKGLFEAHGDPDGLLIAEYCKRIHLGERGTTIDQHKPNVKIGDDLYDRI